MGHRLGLATRTQDQCLLVAVPSAGTAVSLFRAKTVQQRPLLPRKVCLVTYRDGLPVHRRSHILVQTGSGVVQLR